MDRVMSLLQVLDLDLEMHFYMDLLYYLIMYGALLLIMAVLHRHLKDYQKVMH